MTEPGAARPGATGPGPSEATTGCSDPADPDHPGVTGDARAGNGTGFDVLIPAFDEALGVSAVVEAALAAGADRVLVVDDGSTDTTASVAAGAGAEVMRLPENRGKGGALHAGASELTGAVVVMLDADLVGLEGEHVLALARPVASGAADMARGSFVGGRWATTAAQQVAPQLTGQRAMRRDLLLGIPGLATSRYGVEVAITRHASASGWRCVTVPLHGVSQVMKEEKRGFWRGARVRLRMYRDIVSAILQRGGAGRARGG